MVDADDAGTGSSNATAAGGAPRPGPRNALTDVRGLRVGHAQRQGAGWLSGTTVVLAPPGGAVAAVDVRGGGPGTRETDALDPQNLVQQVEAIVLTGGSAFGLDAASGVMEWLEERGRGFRVGPQPAQVVPVVPAAALFDLGRGGDWRARPDAALGREAAAAAHGEDGAGCARGNVGAGTGAVAGGLKGGIGTASVVLPSGVTVAALAAVNASGSPVDPTTGRLYGTLFGPHDQVGAEGDGGDHPGRHGVAALPGGVVSRERHAEAQRRLREAWEESERRSAASVRPPLNTTLAVVATDATLSRAQAQKLAGTAHDGLARAVRPVHLLSDGDTVFALATGERPLVGRAATGAATDSASSAGLGSGSPSGSGSGSGSPSGSDSPSGSAVTPTPAPGSAIGQAADPTSDPAFGVHAAAGALNEVLAAGADVLMRAVVDAILAAESVDGQGGVFPSYRDLYTAPAP
ncbi:P1 family peptidase [Streptomyces buecherae]|uniref:P1 family peptidase n=1 Tax=Streptomyces buecherae TaxID=2763006 RepID=A0A7H8NC04_9ACTN|nr:P1 family peptidase [Streptomyces buecherae]QKW51932.1 P1 family peptidase [Streptomyces buecherae]